MYFSLPHYIRCICYDPIFFFASPSISNLSNSIRCTFILFCMVHYVYILFCNTFHVLSIDSKGWKSIAVLIFMTIHKLLCAGQRHLLRLYFFLKSYYLTDHLDWSSMAPILSFMWSVFVFNLKGNRCSDITFQSSLMNFLISGII